MQYVLITFSYDSICLTVVCLFYLVHTVRGAHTLPHYPAADAAVGGSHFAPSNQYQTLSFLQCLDRLYKEHLGRSPFLFVRFPFHRQFCSVSAREEVTIYSRRGFDSTLV